MAFRTTHTHMSHRIQHYRSFSTEIAREQKVEGELCECAPQKVQSFRT